MRIIGHPPGAAPGRRRLPPWVPLRATFTPNFAASNATRLNGSNELHRRLEALGQHLGKAFGADAPPLTTMRVDPDRRRPTP